MGKNSRPSSIPRPSFPKRAVVTGGMPYGNKELHFGHIGGVFVHADVRVQVHTFEHITIVTCTCWEKRITYM